MKNKIIKIFLYLILLSNFSQLVKAETLPDFPMAFWGKVYINNTLADTNTEVNAYCNNTIIGKTITIENGIYGYDSPIKQKLLVSDCDTKIIFKVKTSKYLSGIETAGSTEQFQDKFESGTTINKDFYFIIDEPTSARPSSGGGSSSGGSSSYSITTTTTKPQGIVLGASTVNVTLGELLAKLKELILEYKQIHGSIPKEWEKFLDNQVIVIATKVSEIARDLALSSQGEDVKILQQFLINQNKGNIANQLRQVGATGYFGLTTKSALAEYQLNVGISPATGYFGKITKDYLKSIGY